MRLTRAALQTAFVVSDDLGVDLAERLFTTPRRYPRPARERAVLASARALTIDVVLRSPIANSAPIPLAAWRWGHGPIVVLVHGWEGRGSQLGAFVAPLVAAGMQVVAFDAPAHGDSPGRRLYLSDHADAIAAVVDAVGPIVGAVAHSFGAASVLLARARNLVAVPRLVAVAPNVILDDAFDRFSRMVGLDDADRGALVRSLALHTGVPVDELGLERLAVSHDDELLVVHDRDDHEVPFEHGERLASLWPGAELLRTEGLGHRRILRDPAAIGAAVALLRAGVVAPKSDLVREIDRYLDGADHHGGRA